MLNLFLGFINILKLGVIGLILLGTLIVFLDDYYRINFKNKMEVKVYE